MRLNADQAYRVTAEMAIPNHRGFRSPHAGPALHRGMILIDRRGHDLANLKRSFTAGIGLVGHDVADSLESLFAACQLAMRMRPDVAVGGIGSGVPAGKAFAGKHVSVVVVAQQDVAGFINVVRPVLRLAVDAHEAVVTADALVVFG